MSMCEASALTADNYSAYCTLPVGHGGAHHAVRSDGVDVATWPQR